MKKTLAVILLLFAAIFCANNVLGAISGGTGGEILYNIHGIDNLPFELAVTAGKIDGFSKVDKFGVNLGITTTTDPEDIWEFGGVYPFDATNTAPIAYLSSSDNTDNQPVEIQGLDINGDLTIQTITLTGQTNVSLTTPLWRVSRMQNEGTSDIAGIAYCHTDPTPTAGVPAGVAVRAIIDDGNNQTLMAIYTIPKGYVAFLYRGEIGVELAGPVVALAEYAHCHYESRRYGKVFKVKKAVTCMVGGGSAVYQDYRSFPDIIPSLTDIRIRAEEVSDTMGLFATFDLLLVEEDKFSDSFLQAIGQPGY